MNRCFFQHFHIPLSPAFVSNHGSQPLVSPAGSNLWSYYLSPTFVPRHCSPNLVPHLCLALALPSFYLAQFMAHSLTHPLAHYLVHDIACSLAHLYSYLVIPTLARVCRGCIIKSLDKVSDGLSYLYIFNK